MGPTSSLEMAHRLDPLMSMLLDHMRVRAREDPARLWRDCMHAFDSILLGSQRIKFTPYVVFFAAYITGIGYARKFAADLVARICDPVRPRLLLHRKCTVFVSRFHTVHRLSRFVAKLTVTLRYLVPSCSTNQHACCLPSECLGQGSAI